MPEDYIALPVNQWNHEVMASSDIQDARRLPALVTLFKNLKELSATHLLSSIQSLHLTANPFSLWNDAKRLTPLCAALQFDFS